MHNIENENGTLMGLMQKVNELAQRKEDYLADTRQVNFTVSDEGHAGIVLEGQGGVPTKVFAVNDVASGQIATSAGLDTRTARRLQESYPQEYSQLINKIHEKEPKNKMFRTHNYSSSDLNPHTFGQDGVVRAVVSDKFKTFDNINLLQSTLPQLIESNAGWKVVNGDVTDKRLYLQLRSQNIEGAGSNVRDVMASGIGLSNSEVGFGSVAVYQMVWTLACLNGMETTNKTRKAHITSAQGDSDTWGLLTNEAKDADNKALELQVRDLTKAYASREMFDEVIEKMRKASENTINGTAQEAVENLGKVIQLTKKETSNVLDGLMATIGQAGYAGEKVSQATMVNAVTAVSHMSDIDNRSDWQRRGSQVLDLSPSDWQRVAC